MLPPSTARSCAARLITHQRSRACMLICCRLITSTNCIVVGRMVATNMHSFFLLHLCSHAASTAHVCMPYVWGGYTVAMGVFSFISLSSDADVYPIHSAAVHCWTHQCTLNVHDDPLQVNHQHHELHSHRSNGSPACGGAVLRVMME